MDPPDDRTSVGGQGCGIKVKGVEVGIGDVDNSRIEIERPGQAISREASAGPL